MASSNKDIQQQLTDRFTLSYSTDKQEDNIQDPKVAEIIVNACKEGDWKTLQETLEINNLSVNCSEPGAYFTPLSFAVTHNQINLVKILVKQKGIDFGCWGGDTDGTIVLKYTLDSRHEFKNANYEMARVLMEAGADIVTPFKPLTLLFDAWSTQSTIVAQLAIEFNASIPESERVFRGWKNSLIRWSRTEDDKKASEEIINNMNQQIALSKQYRKDIGIALYQIVPSKIGGTPLSLRIASFAFSQNTIHLYALNKVSTLLTEHREEQAGIKLSIDLHFQYVLKAPTATKRKRCRSRPGRIKTGIALSLKKQG